MFDKIRELAEAYEATLTDEQRAAAAAESERMQRETAERQAAEDARRAAEPFGAAARLAGSCRNGAERDGGRLWHYLPDAKPSARFAFGRALCGARPGRRSAGWSVDNTNPVTCEKCRRKMEARS